MVNETRVTEFEAIRHDLKNVMSALKSGCMLVEAQLDGEAHETARALLAEMRASVQCGSSLLDRLQQSDLGTRPDSGGSASEVGQ